MCIGILTAEKRLHNKSSLEQAAARDDDVACTQSATAKLQIALRYRLHYTPCVRELGMAGSYGCDRSLCSFLFTAFLSNPMAANFSFHAIYEQMYTSVLLKMFSMPAVDPVASAMKSQTETCCCPTMARRSCRTKTVRRAFVPGLSFLPIGVLHATAVGIADTRL